MKRNFSAISDNASHLTHLNQWRRRYNASQDYDSDAIEQESTTSEITLITNDAFFDGSLECLESLDRENLTNH